MSYSYSKKFPKKYSNSSNSDAYIDAVRNYNRCLNELKLKEEKYNKLEEKVKSWEKYLPNLDELNKKCNEIKVLINNASGSFASGGYISGGVSLGQKEFSKMMQQLEGIDPVAVQNKTATKLDELKKELHKLEIEYMKSLDNMTTASARVDSVPKYPPPK